MHESSTFGVMDFTSVPAVAGPYRGVPGRITTQSSTVFLLLDSALL
jgi:hypothetical protein